MSILIYAEAVNGQYKKTAFELCSYASKLGELLSTETIALTNADKETAVQLSEYGIAQIVSFKHKAVYDSKMMSALISDVAKEKNAACVILADDSRSKALLGRLAVRLEASVVSGVNALPADSDSFILNKSVFSGKAYAQHKMEGDVKVISLARNSVPLVSDKKEADVIEKDVSSYSASAQLVEEKRVQGQVPLPEAELVVSAGRGMKGPENWEIIEELADTIGATTACSRPVSDSGWRPHHEHVGQTGIAIKPNLYIAIGISGAIQHLAGVNNSKTIVVINKDPEAPFFKAADYGVVGDLFDVVPRLNQAFKKFKSEA